MLQRSERILGRGWGVFLRSADGAKPQPGCMQPFTWEKNPGWGEEAGEEKMGREEEEGRLSCKCEPIPGAGLMKNQKKKKEMVEKRRATRIRVYLWSWVGFWAGGGLTGVWLLPGELRDWLGGVHHLTMQSLYLGCSPEVKVLLVEVVIVPVFSLMVMCTEKIRRHRRRL